jgi:hypothetical protein
MSTKKMKMDIFAHYWLTTGKSVKPSSQAASRNGDDYRDLYRFLAEISPICPPTSLPVWAYFTIIHTVPMQNNKTWSWNE